MNAGALTRTLHEISIELTLRCNLSCAMCAVWEGRRDGLAGERVADLLAQARELGARVFVPSGAETLMRRDSIDLLQEAARLGYDRIECPSSGFFGMLGLFRNGGSGSASV